MLSMIVSTLPLFKQSPDSTQLRVFTPTLQLLPRIRYSEERTRVLSQSVENIKVLSQRITTTSCSASLLHPTITSHCPYVEVRGRGRLLNMCNLSLLLLYLNIPHNCATRTEASPERSTGHSVMRLEHNIINCKKPYCKLS